MIPDHASLEVVVVRLGRGWKLFLDLCAPLPHEISDLPGPEEWPQMLGRLKQTRFEALAYHNLRARRLNDAVPGEVMAHLRAANAQALARYHLLGEMVAPHLEALAREVDFLVLKGTAWAHTVYPEPHLRQSGDIDLLVKEEDQAAAGKVLEERGFTGGQDVMSADHGCTYALTHITGAVVYLELHPAICRPARYPHLRGLDATERSHGHLLWSIESRCLAIEMSALHILFELAMEYRIGGYARYLVDLRYLCCAGAFDHTWLDDLTRRAGVRGIHYCCRRLLGDASARAPQPLACLGASALQAPTSSPWARNGRARGTLAALCSLALWDRWDDRFRYAESWAGSLLPRALRKASFARGRTG